MCKEFFLPVMIFMTNFLFATEMDTLNKVNDRVYYSDNGENAIKFVLNDSSYYLFINSPRSTCWVSAGTYSIKGNEFVLNPKSNAICLINWNDSNIVNSNRYINFNIENFKLNFTYDSSISISWEIFKNYIFEDVYFTKKYPFLCAKVAPVLLDKEYESTTDTIYFNGECGYTYGVSGRDAYIISNNIHLSYRGLKEIFIKKGPIPENFPIGIKSQSTEIYGIKIE